MDTLTDVTPSVLTSGVYNDAEAIFALLQNKEKLVSLLDCTTLLRGMGMNPTLADMDKLMARMAEPILRLEQWRREEELRRDKERRKEEARERRRGSKVMRVGAKKQDRSKSVLDNVIAETMADKPRITPAEEIKNIDWNIFISCAEEMFRDAAKEEKLILRALQTFQGAGNSAQIVTQDDLVRIVTSNGDNVLNPSEIKQLRASLPVQCSFAELAARLQGTYVPPTQEEIDQQAAAAAVAQRLREEMQKPTIDDPLAGL